MNSALQVDLAKSEAPAEQVLKSALGKAASNLAVPLPSTNVLEQGSQECPPQNPPRRSSKGGYATTTQVRLKPKASNESLFRNTQEPADSASLELGKPGKSTSVYTLQPADEGFGAWSYVASAFAMYIVVWGMFQYSEAIPQFSCSQLLNYLSVIGFPQAFPIFQTYLSFGEFATHRDSVVLPLLAPGLQDIEEGILFQVFPKSGNYRQMLVIAGIFTMTIAMILASYVTKAWQIVLTQGILFGIGGIMLNFVHVSIFSEWFEKKQGQAMGIIWLGYRVGALVFPPLCQWLLYQHGFKKTLHVLIAPMLALLLPSIVLLRGRYRVADVVSKPVQPPVSKLTALRAPNVLFYLFVDLLFNFAVNVPKMFIVSFGVDISLSASDQALALSLHTLGNMLGTYALGWLSDSLFYEDLLSASAISTSLAHLLIWGFVKTKIALFTYAIIVGLTGGGKMTIFSVKRNH